MKTAVLYLRRRWHGFWRWYYLTGATPNWDKAFAHQNALRECYRWDHAPYPRDWPKK